MSLIQKLQYIRRFDHCPVTLPYFAFAYSNDSVSKLHRLALEIKGRKKTGTRLLYIFFWPLHALELAFRGTIEKEPELKEVGLSRIKAFFLLWKYLLRYNLTVKSFFLYRLWILENQKRAGEYIQHHENIEILVWLNREKEVKEISNKSLFEKLCRTHELPAVEILATCVSTGTSIQTEKLPEIDLFTKLDEMWCGIGAQSWHFNKDDKVWENGELSLKESELLAYLRNKSSKMPTIIQPRLRNSPPIDKFSSGALSTIRIVTFKLPNKSAQYCWSILRMPMGDVEVDNFHAGGLASAIDDRGYLQPAIRMKMVCGYEDSHPDTGEKITGRFVECWQEMVTLALETHDKITNLSTVGWDVAWTQFGPCLIEANVGYDLNIIQMSYNKPIGKEFSELFWQAEEGNSDRSYLNQ